MNDQLIRALLHEVADDVEPGDRLDVIRAATASSGRRTHRGWWAAGGAALVAATVVTALALTTGGRPQGQDPDPAAPTASETSTGPVTVDVTAYYAGETAKGQRLYSEVRSVAGTDQLAAAADALSLAPEDPDYIGLWPADVIEDVSFDGVGDDGQIGVTVDASVRDRPASMTPEQASLAVEQVVRTLQTPTGSKAPLQFYADGSPIDQVLGVPTSEPLTGSPDLAVLAPVSLSEPSDGLVVDNDESLQVRGRGASVNGNLNITVQRRDGTASVNDGTLKGYLRTDRLKAFTMGFSMSHAPAGDYDVIATVRNSDGTVDTDTRRITVVD
jgi:Sporulation and spore germination